MDAIRTDSPQYGTIPKAARKFDLGVKLLRRKALHEGVVPVYYAESKRPRVCFAEVEAWLRSTRIVPAGSREHSEAVVERLLAHEP